MGLGPRPSHVLPGEQTDKHLDGDKAQIFLRAQGLGHLGAMLDNRGAMLGHLGAMLSQLAEKF